MPVESPSSGLMRFAAVLETRGVQEATVAQLGLINAASSAFWPGKFIRNANPNFCPIETDTSSGCGTDELCIGKETFEKRRHLF